MSINLNSTPTVSGGNHHFGRGPLLATLGGAGVLIAVAGAGLWARNGSDESSPAAEAVVSLPSLNTVAPASVADVPANGTRARKDQDVVWIYIVGSRAEANELTIAAASVPGSPSQVVVVDTQEEAAYAATFLRELNPVRAEAGQPEANVVLAGRHAAAR